VKRMPTAAEVAARPSHDRLARLQQQNREVAAQPMTDELLRTEPYAAYLYAVRRVGTGSRLDDTSDPYTRAHRAADIWLDEHGPVCSEDDARTWGMVHFGGHKALAGSVARGYREQLARPGAQASEDYGAEFRCPYRRTYHSGASPGGGTWSQIYIKAWWYGVGFATAQLRRVAMAQAGADTAAAPVTR
jgi:hypothetical protein